MIETNGRQEAGGGPSDGEQKVGTPHSDVGNYMVGNHSGNQSGPFIPDGIVACWSQATGLGGTIYHTKVFCMNLYA